MEDKHNSWARAHKKEIIEEAVAASGATPQKQPMAVIMAGLPGAGKTEISKNLIRLSGINFVRIDMDELAEKVQGYRPKNADQFRLAATILLNELFSFAVKRKLDIVIDGTFSSKYALRNIERLLKRGYSVKIIFVSQHPKVAWEFTKAREKVEHRAIKFNGFIESYYRTLDNIIKLTPDTFGSVGVDLVLKQTDNSIGQWIGDIMPTRIDDYLEIEYNVSKLKKIIKGQA